MTLRSHLFFSFLCTGKSASAEKRKESTTSKAEKATLKPCKNVTIEDFIDDDGEGDENCADSETLGSQDTDTDDNEEEEESESTENLQR